ncbi:hypothetical protein [Citrobacter sp. JGM124]|uniref:hypothetical protein n=1 Tax=Citrobacter sp. JGM124 TaxID=2799789 RepID=UPI001BAAD7E8|nr:hypothetical protein [Citrobacter sp. JGM124]MBS0846976.1 hypothetical protein [Citrobacter sp. JGM124]
MTQQQNKPELSERQKEEIDLMALSRVEAMNSDEYLCQRIDQKVQSMEETLKDYFHLRFSFHKKNSSN